MVDCDQGEALAAFVRAAYEQDQALEIVGGGSRRHLGRTPQGATLALSGHRGIVAYEPSEFVVTVRAGTPLAELRAFLAASGQDTLAEIPQFAPASTVGGALAVGLTGPARPYTGSLRDSVLGLSILSGTGQALMFGGRVLKNVAGFDVSRLMIGAFGTLGVLLDVSLRTARVPEREEVIRWEMSWLEARARLRAWEGAYPLTGACYRQRTLYARFAGREARVAAACRALGGERDASGVLAALRDYALPDFSESASLWRVLVPPDAPLTDASATIGWAGAERFRVNAEEASVRAEAARDAGQVMAVWRRDRDAGPWARPGDASLTLMGRIKAALDPRGLLNRGRLYPDW